MPASASKLIRKYYKNTNKNTNIGGNNARDEQKGAFESTKGKFQMADNNFF